MAWNDAITAGTDWTAATFLQQFTAAINERQRVAGVPGAPGGDEYFTEPTPVAGDDVSAATWIANLQNCVDALLPYFVTTKALSGGVWGAITNFNGGTIATWTVADAHQCVSGQDSWTRKYPREFAALDSATYTDGSAFVNGHAARCQADGRVYDRTAGAWVMASNPEGAVPSVVTTTGTMQAGDYIGAWIWSELRDAINLMLWRAASGGSYVDDGNCRRLGSDSDYVQTWAQVQADAETAYAAASLDAVAVPGAETFMQADNPEEGVTQRIAIVERAKKRLTITLANLPGAVGDFAAYESTTDLYLDAEAPFVGTFDDMGDGLVEGLNLIGTVAETDAATRTTAEYVGDNAAGNVPAPWPADITSGVDALGWSGGLVGAVVKYDGANGFSYKP